MSPLRTSYLTVYVLLDSIWALLTLAALGYRNRQEMNFLPHGNLPPKLEAACKQLEKLAGCPCLLFIMNDGQHFIANSTYEHLYRSRDQIRCSQKGEIALVLSSPGGDLHAAYKIGRFLRTRCKTLKVYVPHQAKSAATFLCLAANEIVLSDRSELGPLDSQHEAPDTQKSRSRRSNRLRHLMPSVNSPLNL